MNRKSKKIGNKILIIGCAGSGKTTLSKKLNAITKLPAAIPEVN